MISHELLLFALCLGLGVVCRLGYVCITKLERFLNLKVITIILDFLMAGIAVAGIVIVVFVFNSGVFMPFMLVSALMGFIALSLLI